MTDSNRVQLGYVMESSWGTTPAIAGTTRLRKVRITGESLNYGIDNAVSNEIRDDRMVSDLVQTGARVRGEINIEWSFPTARTALDDFVAMAMMANWTNMPEKYNATADSSIADAGTTANTYVVDAGGTAYKVAHLVRASGFANAANNQLFRVASSTATTVVGTSLGLVAEAVPPAGARMKVVGFEGASGDITATATGLGSTALDFTTLGLAVGQWIKIGGGTSPTQFATAALNTFCRITAIAAGGLSLDNRPSGWTTDSGAGKTIRVWAGDHIRTAAVEKYATIEKGFLAQATPEYIKYVGMMANGMSVTLGAGEIATGSFGFLGKVGSVGTAALDAAPEAVSTDGAMNAVANVGRIGEGGSDAGSPNFIRSLSIALANNLREIQAVGTLGLVDVGIGRSEVTGSLEAYFGSSSLYTKFLNATETSLNARLEKSSKVLIFTLPRVKFESGQVVVRSSNSDVVAALDFRAIKDTATTGAQFQIDRMEEYA
ncbi:MAG: phage tail tube protein [Pseudomonadota bacterium]